MDRSLSIILTHKDKKRCSFVFLVSLSLFLLSVAPSPVSGETVQELEAAHKDCLADLARNYAIYQKAYTEPNIRNFQDYCSDLEKEANRVPEDALVEELSFRCDRLSEELSRIDPDETYGFYGPKARNPPLTHRHLEKRWELQRCEYKFAEMESIAKAARSKKRSEYAERIDTCEKQLQFLLNLPDNIKFITNACSDIEKRLATARDNLTRQQTTLQVRGPGTITEGQSITVTAELPQNIQSNLLNMQHTGGYSWALDGKSLPGTNSSVTIDGSVPGAHGISVQFWIRKGQGGIVQVLARGEHVFNVTAKQSANQQQASGTCDISGVWINSRGSTWTFTRRAGGSTTYSAREQGLGNAVGTATVTGRSIRLDWTIGDGPGYYEWTLLPGCQAGDGRGEDLWSGVKFKSRIHR